MNNTDKPNVGDKIVWRFKENKGWRSGFVRAIHGDGRIAELVDGFMEDLVAIHEIEWHRK